MVPAHIKWKRIGCHDLPMPCRKTDGAAGFDLALAALGGVNLSGRMELPTGWAVEIPRGYVGMVLPRSGLAVRGFACHPGIIDSDYRGELVVVGARYVAKSHHDSEMKIVVGARYVAKSHHDSEMKIEHGERIAQLLIVPCLMAESVEATTLTETARGEGGFGSTGR